MIFSIIYIKYNFVNTLYKYKKNEIDNNNENIFLKQKYINLIKKNKQDINTIKKLKKKTSLINKNMSSENLYSNNINSERLINPLLPPSRSYPQSSTFINVPGIPINVPTRGYSDEFQQIGVLTNVVNNEVLPLFGRKLYNGGSKWWYYTLTNQQNSVKLPITYKNRNCDTEYGCDEIYDNDEIYISNLNQKMVVSLYKLDSPRYIPY